MEINTHNLKQGGTDDLAGRAEPDSGIPGFYVLEAVIMAVQTGVSMYVGQNLGAGQFERIRDGLPCSFLVRIQSPTGGPMRWLGPTSIFFFYLCFS